MDWKRRTREKIWCWCWCWCFGAASQFKSLFWTPSALAPAQPPFRTGRRRSDGRHSPVPRTSRSSLAAQRRTCQRLAARRPGTAG